MFKRKILLLISGAMLFCSAGYGYTGQNLYIPPQPVNLKYPTVPPLPANGLPPGFTASGISNVPFQPQSPEQPQPQLQPVTAPIAQPDTTQ